MVIQRFWVGEIQTKAVMRRHFKKEFVVSFKCIFLRKLARLEKKVHIFYTKLLYCSRQKEPRRVVQKISAKFPENTFQPMLL